MGFFGGKCLVQGFLGVLLAALGIFWGFDFCPHSIIPITLEIWSTPGSRISASNIVDNSLNDGNCLKYWLHSFKVTSCFYVTRMSVSIIVG